MDHKNKKNERRRKQEDNKMTALYYDTYVGCGNTYEKWTAADEGHVGLFARLKEMFF